MTPELQQLFQQYQHLLGQQKFDPERLDYSSLGMHFTFLNKLAEVENSAVTVFDLYKREHIFASYNFTTLLGYDADGIEKLTSEYFDSRVHPDDRVKNLANGVQAMQFLLALPVAERANYKFVSEFRVLNGHEQYIRVIEQHQALEMDEMGNVWLSLSVMDISPIQEGVPDATGKFINFKTGKIFEISPYTNADKMLTPRQAEILALIKAGLLSKEISDKLSISVHTVNTHRQRILEKLGVDNSMEAIRYATGLGLAGGN